MESPSKLIRPLPLDEDGDSFQKRYQSSTNSSQSLQIAELGQHESHVM